MKLYLLLKILLKNRLSNSTINNKNDKNNSINMKHVKLFEQFIQEADGEELALPEAPAENAEGNETPAEGSDVIAEDEFKALITKLVTHELGEEETEEVEGEEVAEGGLTKEELEKVNAYITASWVPTEETTEGQPEGSTESTDTVENEPIDEIFGFSDEEKAAKLAKAKELALASIMKHPTQSKAYLDWKKKDATIADKFVEFVATHPNDKYFKWDDAKKEFVNTGKFSVASGEGLAGK